MLIIACCRRLSIWVLPLLMLCISPHEAPGDECALVSTYNSDAVVFIDTKTKTVSRTRVLPPASPFFCGAEPRPTDVFPSGIALTADGTRAYIKTGACAVLRLDTDEEADTFFILGGSFINPGEVALTPDDRFAYATDASSDSVLVLDIQAQHFTATIPVSDMPSSLAITPDGRTVYVVNTGGIDPSPDAVSVIDTVSNTVVDTILVGDRPLGIALGPKTGRAYVANSGANAVSVIDTATNTVVDSISVPGSPGFPTASPDEVRLYVGTDAGIAIIDISSRSVVTTVPVTPGRTAVSLDGGSLYVLDDAAESVSVVDTISDDLLFSIPLSARACGTPEFCAPHFVTIGDIPGGCPSCAGDCDGDEVVSISELITGVAIGLGARPVDECRAIDRDVNSSATIDELISAVSTALTDCTAQ